MKKIIAKKSSIHGTGVFLEEPASRGSLLAYIKGNVTTVGKKLLHTPEEALMHPDWVGFSMSRWIDPVVPFKYLNHSCDPTCGVKGRVSLYSLKDLKVGEEITIDYSTTEGNPYWKMSCTCGSARCRGVVRSVAFLPKSIFKKYYPFLPFSFRKFYIRHQKLSVKQNPWIKNLSSYS